MVWWISPPKEHYFQCTRSLRWTSPPISILPFPVPLLPPTFERTAWVGDQHARRYSDALGHYTPAAPTRTPSPYVHPICSLTLHSQPSTMARTSYSKVTGAFASPSRFVDCYTRIPEKERFHLISPLLLLCLRLLLNLYIIIIYIVHWEGSSILPLAYCTESSRPQGQGD